MPLLFDSGRALYHAGLRLAAPFHPKAKAWWQGRKGLWERLEARRHALAGCIWMHCASVGEFEQGRPVLEALKAEHPELPVLLTFFSPSGYEARRNEPLATHVEYLPPDSARNAARFLATVRPSMALVVKYEFWYHHLKATRTAGIPLFLFSALFRPEQPFFRWYGRDWRAMIGYFTAIGTQDEASRALVAGLGYRNARVTGDTRYDRVLRIRENTVAHPLVSAFTGGQRTLVLGSTWPTDEAVVLPAVAARPCKLIIAPHELGSARLDALERKLPGPVLRWSTLVTMDEAEVSRTWGEAAHGTLLVDRMGLLAGLYAHGDVCYVGGGFGDGIHNLLEAAVWDRPVLFGPRHRKFPEADALIKAGGGVEVSGTDDVAKALDQLNGVGALQAGERAGRLVRDRAGATGAVLRMLREHLRP